MSDRAALLPAGTMTLLMTDIEGSSRTWEAEPDLTGARINRHYELIDGVVHRHGGVRPVEQGEGDSTVSAFTHASEAALAAIEAQLALMAELPELPVRMALHTGEVILSGANKYDGMPMIRCARIRAAAHGGQVLLSSSTAAMLSGRLSDGYSLADLGLHAVKGLSAREHIWQLIHPLLRQRFPALATLSVAAGNLPVALTTFVGREADMEVASDLLTEHRLVTLLGPGGAGKTRLAQQLATGLAERYPGGAWWIELAAVSHDDDAVTATIAETLGINPASSFDLVTRIVERFVGGPSALLVLDNCEHVLEAVAEVVHRLLRHCPALRVLATSRAPLGLPGERGLRVPPLRAPPDGTPAGELAHWDAARLFLERAASADPRFVPDDRGAALVATICARVEGVPLALELAAARLRSHSLEMLASSLDESFEGLVGAGPGVERRQHTLTASIAWSYDLLAADEQSALRRLAVFGATFDADAAVAVVSDREIPSPLANTLLGRLVDQSLVQFDASTGRYRLLGAVKEFAGVALGDSHEGRKALARHTRWYAGVAERFGEAGLTMAESALGPELTDVLLALERAMVAIDPTDAYRIIIGLGPRWHLFGRFEQMQRAATWVLGRTPSDGQERWAAAFARLAYQAIGAGRVEFEAFIDEATAIAELTGDVATLLYLRYWPAVDDAYAGRLESSERLVADARAAGVSDLVMSVARNLVSVHAVCGRIDDAAHMADLAVAVAVGAGRDVSSTESAHAFLAAALAFGGDLAGARHWLGAGEFLGIVGRPNGALVHAALAYWLGDPTLAATARELLTGEAHPINGSVVARANWFLHLCDGDLAAAVLVAAEAPEPPLPVVRCYFQLLDAQLAVAMGHLHRAAELVDGARRLIPADAPQLDAMADLADAQRLVAAGDESVGRELARSALRRAEQAGLAWIVRDASRVAGEAPGSIDATVMRPSA